MLPPQLFWLTNPALLMQTYIHNEIGLILLVKMEALNRWSVIECQIAVICACLPATRALIVCFCPGVLSISSGQSHPYRTTSSSRVAAGLSRPGGNSHISKTVSYSVDYGTEPQESFKQFNPTRGSWFGKALNKPIYTIQRPPCSVVFFFVYLYIYSS